MTWATGEFTALASAVRVRLVSWFIIRAAFARHNTSQTRLAGHKDFYQRFLRQAGCVAMSLNPGLVGTDPGRPFP